MKLPTQSSQKGRKVVMANFISAERTATMVNSLISAALARRCQQHNYGREKMHVGMLHTQWGLETGSAGDDRFG